MERFLHGEVGHADEHAMESKDDHGSDGDIQDRFYSDVVGTTP